MKVTKKMELGGFQQQLDEQDVVVVPKEVVARLERALFQIETSSLIVRLDMSPWGGQGTPPLYEMETAPGGLMFWSLFPSFPTGEIAGLADAAVCTYPDWIEAYSWLSEATGWPVFGQWEDVPHKSRVYYSGEPLDPEEQKWAKVKELFLVTDPFCPKTEILKITGGRLLKPGETASLSEFKEFSDGLVIKPVWGFGCREVLLYPRGPRCGWMRKQGGCSGKKIRRVLRIPSHEERIVQPFFSPEVVSRENGVMGFRIWRIYAIRRNFQKPFRLIGGLWNWRPHLLIHGASNTVQGAVIVEGR